LLDPSARAVQRSALRLIERHIDPSAGDGLSDPRTHEASTDNGDPIEYGGHRLRGLVSRRNRADYPGVRQP
jgi:hypothetical protein